MKTNRNAEEWQHEQRQPKTSTPLRIVFVISSLSMGGAQRVVALLANGLSERGHFVSILTFEPKDAQPYFPIAPNVTVQALNLARPSANSFSALARGIGRLVSLRGAIQKYAPSVVIPFMDSTNVLTLLALLGTHIPVIACERTNPCFNPLGYVWSYLRRATYPLAARITAQTKAAAAMLPGRTVVLPNPVSLPEQATGPWPLPPGPQLVAMGRLSDEKGFQLLIQAFARIAPVLPAWKLVIVGEGPMRQRLEAQVSQAGLAERILLPGHSPTPSSVLRTASLFVLPSRFEGFPNALCEAMAYGLPAVAFDCPSGPAEILRHGVDGLLVPAQNVDDLTAALTSLMVDESTRLRMAQRAPEILERFGLERVLKMWEDLLNEVVHLRTP